MHFVLLFLNLILFQELGVGIDVDYEMVGLNGQVEADYINEEASIVKEYKCAFDRALKLIDDRAVEHAILEAENSW